MITRAIAIGVKSKSELFGRIAMDYGLSVCRNHDWHAGSNARASRLIAWDVDTVMPCNRFAFSTSAGHSVAVPIPPIVSDRFFMRPIMSILIIATVLASGTTG